MEFIPISAKMIFKHMTLQKSLQYADAQETFLIITENSFVA